MRPTGKRLGGVPHRRVDLLGAGQWNAGDDAAQRRVVHVEQRQVRVDERSAEIVADFGILELENLRRHW